MNRRAFNQLAVTAAMAQLLPRATAQSAAANSDAARFSVMIWALNKQLSFEQAIDVVAAAGYQGIELTGQFQKWSPEETRKMLAKIHGAGLIIDSMSGVNAGFTDPAGSANFMKQLTEHLHYAKDLGCPQVILLSGKGVEGMSPEAQHSACVENLKPAAELAGKNDIEIVIEPIDKLENPTIYMDTVTKGFAIARDVASPHLKVLYDFYHEQRTYGNLIEKLEKNIDMVGLVHIADVPGRHEPGTGEVDFANIYRKLGELKYNKFIAMEFYPTQDAGSTLKTARMDAQKAMNAG